MSSGGINDGPINVDPINGGANAITGTGSVTAPVGLLSGSGALAFSGSGSVTAPVGLLSGDGSISGVIPGGASGGLAQAQAPIRRRPRAITGRGSVTAPPGQIQGRAVYAIQGRGGVTAQAGKVDGAGRYSDDALVFWLLGMDEEAA